ncbi:MAG: tripartite tricarboxylate transporter TctB family protein [Clostridia bacterium]|nr:tripartite tricarboxylate transporter TctB family protein [Clostridia bacterium]
MRDEERTYKYREYFVLLGTLAINIFLFYHAVLLYRRKPKLDAPGTFPLLLTSVMLLLNVLVFVETYRKTKGMRTEPFGSRWKAIAAAVAEELPLNVIVSVLATAAYFVLMNAIGFAVSTFVFLVGLSLFLDRGKWKTVLVSSAAITGAIYLIFGVLFHVRLP